MGNEEQALTSDFSRFPNTERPNEVIEWIRIFDEQVEGTVWNTTAEALDFKTGKRQGLGPYNDSGLYLNNYKYRGIVAGPAVTNLSAKSVGNQLENLWVAFPDPATGSMADLEINKLLQDHVGRFSQSCWAFRLPTNYLQKFIGDIQGSPDLLPSVLEHFAKRNKNVGSVFLAGSTGMSACLSPKVLFLIPYNPANIPGLKSWDEKSNEFRKGLSRALDPSNNLHLAIKGAYPKLGQVR